LTSCAGQAASSRPYFRWEGSGRAGYRSVLSKLVFCGGSTHPSATTLHGSANPHFVIPSLPGFPATLHVTQPRVRFSVGENRMKSANAIKINRKSGVAEGPAVRLDAKQRPSLLRHCTPVSCLGRTKRLVKACELTRRAFV
jgi:hypothetical protein